MARNLKQWKRVLCTTTVNPPSIVSQWEFAVNREYVEPIFFPTKKHKRKSLIDNKLLRWIGTTTADYRQLREYEPSRIFQTNGAQESVSRFLLHIAVQSHQSMETRKHTWAFVSLRSSLYPVDRCIETVPEMTINLYQAKDNCTNWPCLNIRC